MNARALSLAIQLLTAAAAGVALSTVPGCFLFDCGDSFGWQPQTTRDLGVDANLEVLVEIPPYEEAFLAAGSGGTVVVFDSGERLEVYNVSDFDLHGALVTAGWWVVGDGGTVVESADQGQTWTPAELGGTSANLWGVAAFNDALVVVGDGVVFVRDAAGTWAEATAPGGGWGDLRGVHVAGDRVYVFGRAGVVWSTDDPMGSWAAQDVSVDADLLDAGALELSDGTTDDARFVIIGAAGTLVIHEPSGAWSVVSTGVSADLIDLSGNSVLDADGVVYTMNTAGGLENIEDLGTYAGMLALHRAYGDEVLTVGEGGMSISQYNRECIGGRPFSVAGELRTASLRASDQWCVGAAEPARAQPSAELAQQLAAAWAQDGLYEHASVASFARFTLELLALGAPPQHLREAQAAIQDELRHAQLCFGLARRFGGAPVGPSALEIPAAALARVGDPVATALALFEEGCLNESVAACEAADALECCVDAEVRMVLETLAADERRHATAAWGALRWLLDTYGEQVREPLRRRVASLGVPRERDEAQASSSVQLAAYGRSSAHRRAGVQRRVIAELVLPLAHTMLSDPGMASTASSH